MDDDSFFGCDGDLVPALLRRVENEDASVPRHAGRTWADAAQAVLDSLNVAQNRAGQTDPVK